MIELLIKTKMFEYAIDLAFGKLLQGFDEYELKIGRRYCIHLKNPEIRSFFNFAIIENALILGYENGIYRIESCNWIQMSTKDINGDDVLLPSITKKRFISEFGNGPYYKRMPFKRNYFRATSIYSVTPLD